jgi:hypothetical protein
VIGAVPTLQETHMKKTITSVLAAAAVAAALVGSATDASAQRRGWVAPAIIGGFVAGAIVGSAVTNSRPAWGTAYVVQPGYSAYPGYVMAAPVGCPGGYWARKPVAFDRWGNPVAWGRPRFFCP